MSGRRQHRVDLPAVVGLVVEEMRDAECFQFVNLGLHHAGIPK